MRDEPAHRFGAVEVRGVFPDPGESAWSLLELKRRIELGRAVSRVGWDDIDVAQVHDCFSLTELLSYEDLGFCEKGSAKEHIADGDFELSGRLPVNTDGGLKTFGHPTGATGVRMIYENVLQLQGRAGERQIKGARTALSHNIGGYPTVCGIAVLGLP